MGRFLWLVAVCCLILAGCGGGSGDSPSVLTRSVQVTWADRTREALHGPASALSAKFTILRGDSFGDDIVFTVDRDPGRTESYVGTYPIPNPISSTSFALQVRFFAGAGATGDVVAEAQGTFNSSGPTIELANIVMDTEIKSVTVTPLTLDLESAPSTLAFSAYDADGHLVAVSRGSAEWGFAEPSNAIELTADGVATPKEPGRAMVTATVDGVSSAPVLVGVRPLFTHVFRFSRPGDTLHLTGGGLAGACDLRTSFTVEAIVRVTGPGILWQQWRDTYMNQVMWVHDNNWSALTTGSGSIAQPLLGDGIVPNQWTHIAWTWDGQIARVYRDGHLVRAIQSASRDVPIVMGQACAIGKNATVPHETNQSSFTGDLAAFRISSMARYTEQSYVPPTRPWALDDATMMLVDPSSLAGSPTTFSLPGSQGLTADVGIPKGTAPTLEPYSM